jgi:hypothetical protein
MAVIACSLRNIWGTLSPSQRWDRQAFAKTVLELLRDPGLCVAKWIRTLSFLWTDIAQREANAIDSLQCG